MHFFRKKTEYFGIDWKRKIQKKILKHHPAHLFAIDLAAN